MNPDAAAALEKSKLVVVGASAGGIEALSTLVSTLRADFPAPVVLAQHLDPQRRSHLESILQRRTDLPIVQVHERTPLEPGKIYVVPSNTHVAIADGHVDLQGGLGSRPRPSVDLLLSTAAAAYGENLIAIILTGSGSDGAAGAVEASLAGGTVVIQDPQTALYPSMPLALPPTVVDYTVDVEEMGPLLYELTQGLAQPAPPPELADPLHDIMDRVSQQSSIDFRQYKPATIVRRIFRRMTVTHTATMRDYVRYLDQHPEEVGELVRSFLIKVTEFFRDRDAFVYLKNTILPDLITRARAKERVLRFWSAGCATGEEPYSLALLLADLLGPELGEWSVRIFATDLDTDAVAFARRGVYPENLLRNLPDDYRQRFFEPTDRGFRVAKFLRQMVIFGEQDLSRGVPFPRIDLVICRNLLIYFKPELQQTVLDIFAYSLQQAGGYLFLGQAETVRPSKAVYELVNKRWKIYRCLSGPLPLLNRPVARLPATLPPDRPSGPRRPPVELPELRSPPPPVSEVELGQLRRLNEWVLRFLPHGVVVIDRTYRILTINGTARRLLGIREAGVDQDFLHSVRGLPYEEVRGAIDTVFRERGGVTLPELEVEATASGELRYLTLSIVLMHLDNDGPDLALISVTDLTEQVQTRRHLESVQRDQKQLLEELQVTNRRFGEMNKELQDANEELQAANEEMMLTQEELQATNEEFEATNEELQATNEEFEATNEELQATNEELETTNEELQARTNELAEVTRNLVTERTRLLDMVELAPFYILLLYGPDLQIEAFNPRYAQLLGAREVVGLPLADVFTDPAQAELVSLVHEVYQQNTARTTPRMPIHLPNEQGRPVARYFVYTIVPTHGDAGKVNGIVIYADDVSVQVEDEAAERRENLKLMIEHADQVALALFDAQTRRLVQASPRYLDIVERATGYARDTILGRPWQEMAFFSSSPDEAQELFQAVLAGGESRRLPGLRVRLGDEDQEAVWDCSLTPIPAGPPSLVPQVQFVVVSAVEVTQPTQALQQLAEVDRLKDEFMSLASHELRTPLVPLRGYADLLKRLIRKQETEPGWDPRIGDYVGKFDQQIRYLSRLVDDLFDATRLQTGKFTLDMQRVDLTEVVAQAVEQGRMLADTPPIHLTMPEDEAPLPANVDPQRLIQVVLNLLQNAVRHAAESPAIDVRVRRLPAGRRAGKHRADGAAGGEAEITVHDQGPGISPEVSSSLFTRYYQGPRGATPGRAGLGLGLFIARQIVEQHGGSISLESTVGKGSTFTVRLPLAPAPNEC